MSAGVVNLFQYLLTPRNSGEYAWRNILNISPAIRIFL